MTHPPRLDVVVVGRGPAAFAAALTARQRGLSVAIIGAADTAPRWGETLPGSCLPILSRLGVADELWCGEHLPEYGRVSVWGEGGTQERSGIFSAYGGGVILDRERFVRRLETAFRSEGGRVIEAKPSKIRRTGGCYYFGLAGEPGGGCLSARAIVDATGMVAWVSRHLGARRTLWARQIAYGACYEAPSAETLPATTFIEAIEQGWLYATPVAAHRAVVWWVSDADLLLRAGHHDCASTTAQARRSFEISRWLREWRLQETGEWRIRNASVGGLDSGVGNGWIAVGDAAFSLDPLSSSGITLALLSGLHGGTAVAEWLNGKADALTSYARVLAHAAKSHLEQRRRFHRAEHRWPEAAFWKRRNGDLSSSGDGQPIY